MRTRLVTRVSGFRRSLAVGAGVVLAAGVATASYSVASAAPKPTISQVQAKVNALQSKFDNAVQQYDQVMQQLNAAKARLTQVNKKVAHDQDMFKGAKAKVVQIAASAYENSASTSLAGLLTTNNPSTVLSQASMLMQLTAGRNSQTQEYLSAAQQLASVQQVQQRTEYGIAQLAGQRKHQRNQIGHLLHQQKAILDTLTAQQQQQVTSGGVGGGGGGTGGTGGGGGGHTPGPASGAAAKAVAFAKAQLGCAYVYGATGPCAQGFDCSGLQQAAWGYAGVSIPRTTYEQWAALPHIPLSQIQIGDLLYYNGEGHVAMYVGGGMIIDAPTQGIPVEEISMQTSWYAQNFDGAVHP